MQGHEAAALAAQSYAHYAYPLGTAREEEHCLLDQTAPAQTKETAMAQEPPLNPGDEADPGVPGTGEDLCPDCNGSGKRDSAECATCAGTGMVTQGIGGG
ncbi:putative uncharacterized protein [Caballeronia insecticola]|uniref:Uncharacterized protein n=2 Tax=Caballeronia insecticola TaxID=758793 RepID=R4X2G6_9BURK|nr:putative uncharacterized protein [Caballeronia insecticola]